MIFKRKKSILNKILDHYPSLFEQWERKCFNDGSIDEITYTKDNITNIAQTKMQEINRTIEQTNAELENSNNFLKKLSNAGMTTF